MLSPMVNAWAILPIKGPPWTGNQLTLYSLSDWTRELVTLGMNGAQVDINRAENGRISLSPSANMCKDGSSLEEKLRTPIFGTDELMPPELHRSIFDSLNANLSRTTGLESYNLYTIWCSQNFFQKLREEGWLYWHILFVRMIPHQTHPWRHSNVPYVLLGAVAPTIVENFYNMPVTHMLFIFFHDS